MTRPELLIEIPASVLEGLVCMWVATNYIGYPDWVLTLGWAMLGAKLAYLAYWAITTPDAQAS